MNSMKRAYHVLWPSPTTISLPRTTNGNQRLGLVHLGFGIHLIQGDNLECKRSTRAKLKTVDTFTLQSFRPLKPVSCCACWPHRQQIQFTSYCLLKAHGDIWTHLPDGARRGRGTPLGIYRLLLRIQVIPRKTGSNLHGVPSAAQVRYRLRDKGYSVWSQRRRSKTSPPGLAPKLTSTKGSSQQQRTFIFRWAINIPSAMIGGLP